VNNVKNWPCYLFQTIFCCLFLLFQDAKQALRGSNKLHNDFVLGQRKHKKFSTRFSALAVKHNVKIENFYFFWGGGEDLLQHCPRSKNLLKNALKNADVLF